MKILFLAVLFSLFLMPAAQACSPAFDAINRPIALKLKADDFFIGKVEAVTEKEVTFLILTPGGITKDKKSGETIVLPLGEHGTCGSLNFVAGDVWIYNGDSISFSPSVKLEQIDLKDGTDIVNVKRNVVSRLDPAYQEPKKPTKDDLPIPGVYAASMECGEGKPAATYSLTIGAEDPATKKYKVDIVTTSCASSAKCEYSGQAPAYGYGEIVLPLSQEEGQAQQNCSVLVQQMSAEDEWPALKQGEARFLTNDGACPARISNACASPVMMTSPVLKKTP